MLSMSHASKGCQYNLDQLCEVWGKDSSSILIFARDPGLKLGSLDVTIAEVFPEMVLLITDFQLWARSKLISKTSHFRPQLSTAVYKDQFRSQSATLDRSSLSFYAAVVNCGLKGPVLEINFSRAHNWKSVMDRASRFSMDPIAKETSEALARDSLMAISQSTPEKNLDSEVLPAEPGDAGVIERKDSGRAEKYRSKLMSISKTQSPDSQPVESSVEN